MANDCSQFQEPNWTPVTSDDLMSSLEEVLGSVASMTTGLGTENIAPHPPTISDVIDVIKGLDLGPGTQKDDLWDCTERAMWCIAHIRHMFPGIAIGMVEGNMTVGEITDDLNHAVLVLWNEKLEPTFLDPIQIGKPVSFSTTKRITAFPFAPNDQPDTVEPMKTLGLDRLKEGEYVHYDKRYWIYSKNDVMDYLKKWGYDDDKCPDRDTHSTFKGDRSYWASVDAAFWAYSHARRKFPGCATGVAIGTLKGNNDPTAVNLIFTKDNDDIKPIYWRVARLLKNRKEVVGFKPNMVFI